MPERSARVAGLDHIVLTVSNLAASRGFWAALPGVEVREFAPGRWAVWVGRQKLNLHEAGREFLPAAARPTPGAADLCLLVEGPLATMISRLESLGVEIVEGPVMKRGATGPIRSIYVRDPDRNLVELAEPASNAGGLVG